MALTRRNSNSFNPALGQSIHGTPRRKRFVTLPDALPIVFVIGAVIGETYTGWATPTEVGARDAFIVFRMAVLKRSLSPPSACRLIW